MDFFKKKWVEAHFHHSYGFNIHFRTQPKIIGGK